MWVQLIIVIAAGLLVFFSLIKFTAVKESTAKVIVRFGGFQKVLLAYTGYVLDQEGNIVPSQITMWTKIQKKLGGLRFVGIRWLDHVYSYNFRWRDVQLAGGERKVQFHEEMIDYIFVRPDIYWTEIKNAETKPPERIALSLHFLVTLRVINPYKALFMAPSNWNENVMTRLDALFRGWVATKKLDDLLALRGKEGQPKIWEDFRDDPLIEIIKKEWGIQMEESGIQLLDIDMAPDVQRAIAAKSQQSLEASGRAAQTIGTIIAMMAHSRGKSETVIKKEINADPELRQEFLRLAEDLVVRQQSIEGKSYLDIRVQGAEGFERTLLNALAAWQRMPSPSGPSGKNKSPSQGGQQASETENDTVEIKVPGGTRRISREEAKRKGFIE